MDGLDASHAFLLWFGDLLLTGQMSLVLQVTLATVFILSGTYKVRHPVAAATSAARFGFSVRPTKTGRHHRRRSRTHRGGGTTRSSPSDRARRARRKRTSLTSLTVLTARAVVRGESFDCSCLGHERVSKSSVARAAAMLVASVVAGAGVTWGGPRTIDLETASTAAGMALAIVCLPYTAGLASRVRSLRGEFEEKVDWGWLVQELSGRRGA